MESIIGLRPAGARIASRVNVPDSVSVGKGMIGNRKRWTVAAFVMALTLARVWPASANALSFPPTNFAILNPDTGTVIGRSRYRLDSAGDGATLRGENGYFDGQTDVEVARLKLAAQGNLPKLLEFDHTFYNADRSILKRAHLDLEIRRGRLVSTTPAARGVTSRRCSTSRTTPGRARAS